MVARLVIAWVLLSTAAVWPAHADDPDSIPTSLPTGAPVAAGANPALRASVGVEVVYTGNGFGVASYAGSGSTILALWEALTQKNGSTRIERTGEAALRKGDRLLFDPHTVRAADPIALLGRPVRGKVVAEQLEALESDRMLLFEYPPQPDFDLLGLMERHNTRGRRDPSLHRVRGRLVEYTRGNKRLLLFERAPVSGAPEPLDPDPLNWELWWMARGSARLGQRQANYYMVLKAAGSGPRRVRYLERLSRELGDRRLLLSAGGDLAITNPIDARRHPMRDADLALLSRLGYDAIAPGPRELYFGLADLLRAANKHRLPLVASNLYHKRGKRKGKPVFPRYLIKRVHGVRVAVIGLVDADVTAKAHDPRLADEIEVRDPVQSTTEVITELTALPDARPDLVIALGALRGAALQDFISESYGVDVLIGDFGGAFGGAGIHAPVERLDLRARRQEEHTSRHVALVTRCSRSAVGRLTFTFEPSASGLALASLTHRRRWIDSELPRDNRLHRMVMRGHHKLLGRMQAPLIPAIERIIAGDESLLERVRSDPEIARWLTRQQTKHWQLWFTGRIWSDVVANLVRHATGAEIAMVGKATGIGISTPGPVLESYARQWMQTDATLQAYELTGAALRKLVTATASSRRGVALTGVDPKQMLVEGRPLRDEERYAVVMTNMVAADPPIAAALRGVTPIKGFASRGGARYDADADGDPARLRDVVLATLGAMRKAHPRFDEHYLAQMRRWLVPRGAELLPRWTVAARALTLSFSNYANYPSAAWLRNPGVRETRAVTPNNYTLGVSGSLALTYDSTRIAWETETRLKLARTVIDLAPVDPSLDEVEQETADDLVFSSELKLKFIELGLGAGGRLKIVPYTKAAFDTELTPTVNQITGSLFPHQKELSVAAGLLTNPGQMLEEIRLAALFKNDFSLSRGQAEGGLLAGLKLSFPLWRARLKVGGTLRYFPPTDSDTVEDLGLILDGSAKLVVPFTRDLSVSLMADLFLYRPKVRLVDVDFPDGRRRVERVTATSLILGGGISFDHLWKL